jgi:hypothetical protein
MIYTNKYKMQEQLKQQNKLIVSIPTLIKNLTLASTKILVEIMITSSDQDTKNIFVIDQTHSGQERLLKLGY